MALGIEKANCHSTSEDLPGLLPTRLASKTHRRQPNTLDMRCSGLIEYIQFYWSRHVRTLGKVHLLPPRKAIAWIEPSNRRPCGIADWVSSARDSRTEMGTVDDTSSWPWR